MTLEPKKTVSALLKETYDAHILTVKGLTNDIDVLMRKCDRLTKFKNDILTRGKDLQRRYDQLLEVHRFTQMTLAEATASETDRTAIDDIRGEEIGARFPSVREARRDTRDGMDRLDGGKSAGSIIGEEEGILDLEGTEDITLCSQGRLKLANGRKRTRYREEEKLLKNKKLKLSDDDTSPTQSIRSRRRLGTVSRNTESSKTEIDGDRINIGINCVENDISRISEDDRTKCDILMESFTGSAKRNGDRTKQTSVIPDVTCDYEASSQDDIGCENVNQKMSILHKRGKLSGKRDHQTKTLSVAGTDVLRLTEQESVAQKMDSHVLFVPETCYPDTCDPESIVVMEAGDESLQTSAVHSVVTPIRSKKQNRRMRSQFEGRGSPGEKKTKMARSCGGSLVKRGNKQDSVCGTEEEESGDESEVFLLPEVRCADVLQLPLCNSTPIDDSCKVAPQRNGDIAGCRDKLGGCIPLLLDSPVLHSPMRVKQKHVPRKSVGSPLLFDDDADRLVHQKFRARQTSNDASSPVRTIRRDRLGGKSEVERDDEAIAVGQLLSSSADASKPADNIFFKDAESCSLNATRKTRKQKVDTKTLFAKTMQGDSSSRNLVQTTLSQHLQPNAGDVASSTMSRIDVRERLMIERAKKASLEDLGPCVSNNPPIETPHVLVSPFKEPRTPQKHQKKNPRTTSPHCNHTTPQKQQRRNSSQSTSPLRSHTTRQDQTDIRGVVPETFPEEWDGDDTADGHPLNGSLHPDMRLSAYICTQGNRQEDEAVTMNSQGVIEKTESERDVDSWAPSVVFDPVRRRSSVATVEENPQDEDDCPETHRDVDEVTKPNDSVKEKKAFDDSFDRAPKASRPNYAYRDVVRKQAERRQLTATVCPQCDQYFSTLGLSDEEKRERMKSCRHRDRFAPPPTPDHFWSVGFPDTQECEERGYIHTTQAHPSRFRRKRGLKKLSDEDTQNGSMDQP